MTGRCSERERNERESEILTIFFPFCKQKYGKRQTSNKTRPKCPFEQSKWLGDSDRERKERETEIQTILFVPF